jgi:D-xylose transport system permease protein
MSEATPQQAGILEFMRNNVRRYTMFIALIGIWIIFTVLTKGIFISTRNLSNLFLQTATVAILTAGMVQILVAAQIDLSLGYFICFIGGLTGAMQVMFHLGTLASMGIGMAAALLVGCWHGYWIAYRGIPAFIITLASQLILRGAMLWVTQGRTQTPLNTTYLPLGQGFLMQFGLFKNDSTFFLMVLILLAFVLASIRAQRARKRKAYAVQATGRFILGLAAVCAAIAAIFGIMISYRGVPYAILITLAIMIIFTFVTNNTVFGRQLYAIGGNSEAARLSGINIKKRIFMIYIIMAGLVAIAAFVFTARLGGASTLSGPGMELDVIAAAFIGGTSVYGGIGTIPGAVVGALVMSSIDNGMSLMDLPNATQFMVKGLILLAAVWFDISTRNSKRKLK